MSPLLTRLLASAGTLDATRLASLARDPAVAGNASQATAPPAPVKCGATIPSPAAGLKAALSSPIPALPDTTVVVRAAEIARPRDRAHLRLCNRSTAPMKPTALLAALLALTAPAAAHDLWLDPTGSGVQVLYGHPHEPELPSAGKLMSLSAYEPAGAVALKARLEAGPAPTLSAAHRGDALFAAAYDNGYWVRLPDGSYRNASKRMLPQADKSLWSVKFAKAVSGPAAPWGTVVGQTLEIVPLEAPSSASGQIRVRVLFEGRPLDGASVVATDGVSFKSEADQARATTDGSGVAVVPLRRAGPQVLGVSHRVTPSQTPALADADSYGATLAFTVIDPKTN
jgi:uncharacterized GH25 family protein